MLWIFWRCICSCYSSDKRFIPSVHHLPLPRVRAVFMLGNWIASRRRFGSCVLNDLVGGFSKVGLGWCIRLVRRTKKNGRSVCVVSHFKLGGGLRRSCRDRTGISRRVRRMVVR